MTTTATVRRSAGRKRPPPPARGKPPAPRTRRARKRRTKRRRAVAFLVMLLVLALIGGSLWGMYFSPALVTKRVKVIGTHDLTPTQVSLAAQVPLGVPLARQDLDAIAQRTTTLPAIEAASATREWPNTLTVTVVERRPVIAVREPEGYVLVDRSGVAYQTQRVLPPEVLLAVVNPGDVELLSDMATVVAASPKKLRSMVDRMTAANRDSITLVLESGKTVTWGSSADSELKAQVVMALLKRKPKSSIDVSSPHNPAVQ
jgi:cell division protein FtsQ